MKLQTAAGFLLLALFVTGTRNSTLPVYLPMWVPPAHVLFTIVLCFLGSLLAMRRATSIDPASAFR
jgi:ABC-type lipoprotein release transport system permease subunit